MPFETETETLRRGFQDDSLSVTATRRLSGGMINTVELWQVNGKPDHVVAKQSSSEDTESLRIEYESLLYYAERTDFPVPQPYAFLPPLNGNNACLLMEWIQGEHLGAVALTEEDRLAIEREMARHVASLHETKRNHYGHAVAPPPYNRFLDYFEPCIRGEFESISNLLNFSERAMAESILSDLERWLPETDNPTLIHGDLWATNIMVDPEDKRILAYIDGASNFRDPEQELAYLLIFGTVGEAFFQEYADYHPIRDGFARRCRIFWLNTWMRHVRKFGSQYLAPTKRTLQELAQLS